MRKSLSFFVCILLSAGCQATSTAMPGAPPHASFKAHQDATLAAQVGQMLLVGFSGTGADDAGVQEARRAAEAGEIGGLILHQYNIVSPPQLKALIAHVRTWQVATPLLVCINQEGGAVQRLSPAQGFRSYPSALKVAQLSAPQIQAVYTQMADELRQLGIDVNFAPVVDLHDPLSMAIGARERSFAASPAEVTRLAAVLIAAHKAAGVRSVLKHFVGHGAAVGDTHKGFADVTERYTSEALAPYVQLIKQGAANAIMTAHLTNRTLEPSGEPLTFSRALLEQRLRSELGFDGVIISDDLQMGALTQHYALEDILERSVVAGHDLLLFSQNQAADGTSSAAFRAIPHLHAQTLASVERAMARGTLTAAQMAQHHARVLRFKAHLPAPPPQPF